MQVRGNSFSFVYQTFRNSQILRIKLKNFFLLFICIIAFFFENNFPNLAYQLHLRGLNMRTPKCYSLNLNLIKLRCELVTNFRVF